MFAFCFRCLFWMLILFSTAVAFGSHKGKNGIVYASNCNEALAFAKYSSAGDSCYYLRLNCHDCNNVNCYCNENCYGPLQYARTRHAFNDEPGDDICKMNPPKKPVSIVGTCLTVDDESHFNIMKCTAVSKNLVNVNGRMVSE